MTERDYFVHPSAYVDEPCEIGEGTQDLALLPRHEGRQDRRALHPRPERLRRRTTSSSATTSRSRTTSRSTRRRPRGRRLLRAVVRLHQRHQPALAGHPAQPVRQTLVRRGATIGANATIVCGATIGRYAFIAAGAVVRGDVPDYALMIGVPARQPRLDEPPRPPAGQPGRRRHHGLPGKRLALPGGRAGRAPLPGLAGGRAATENKYRRASA